MEFNKNKKKYTRTHTHTHGPYIKRNIIGKNEKYKRTKKFYFWGFFGRPCCLGVCVPSLVRWLLPSTIHGKSVPRRSKYTWPETRNSILSFAFFCSKNTGPIIHTSIYFHFFSLFSCLFLSSSFLFKDYIEKKTDFSFSSFGSNKRKKYFPFFLV